METSMLNEFVEVIWPKGQHKESIRGVVRTVNDEGVLHVEAYLQRAEVSGKWLKVLPKVHVAHPGFSDIRIIPGGPNISSSTRELVEEMLLNGGGGGT